MTDGSIRASDNDREQFVSALREAFSEGRLTMDEFDERTTAAYAARTWGELRELTDDLPAPPVLSIAQPGVLRPVDQQQPEPADVLDTADLLAAAPPMRPVNPDLMRTMPRRPRPFGRLLPVVFIWAVIAAGAGASQLAAILAVVFLGALAIRVLGGGLW